MEERFLSNFNHGEENQIFSRVTGVIAKNEIHGLNDSREAGSRIAGRNRGCTVKCRKARNNFATKHQQRTAVCCGSAILMSPRKK